VQWTSFNLSGIPAANGELLRPNGQLSEKIGEMGRKCPQNPAHKQYRLATGQLTAFPVRPSFLPCHRC
jgi:hypothetical protein